MPLHIFLAHFPFALILVGAAADTIGTVLQKERIRVWAGSALMLGSFFAVLAFLTGQRAMSYVLSQPQPPYQLVADHSQWGGAGLWVLVGAGVLRGLWRRRLTGLHGWGLLALAILSAVLIVFISATGTAITHGR
jgi:uncharacterized membrane protein